MAVWQLVKNRKAPKDKFRHPEVKEPFSEIDLTYDSNIWDPFRNSFDLRDRKSVV